MPSAQPAHASPQRGRGAELPAIVSIDIRPGTVLHAGDNAFGTVLTSKSVASVELRIANVGMTMEKVDAGRFELAYRVPSLPFPLLGDYTLHVIARNARGDKTESAIGIRLQ